jgi:peptide/nickel transport system ATP-binding protein
MPIIDVQNLHFSYRQQKSADAGAWVLRNVSFALEKGGFLGVVGESGSGKSTLVRVLCGLLPVSQGRVSIAGKDVSTLDRAGLLQFRRNIQLIYQNPKRSFDPRMKIGLSISQPVRSLERRIPSRDELASWLEQVGLRTDCLERFPHELSGGQLQRIAIARALSVRPSILLADEPTSALDVSVQAQSLKLIAELREKLDLTLVLVSHDLAVVGRITDNVVVLKDGVIVESGDTARVLLRPEHPYTRALAAAARAVSL